MTPPKKNRSAKCPVCAKPARAEHVPFCSARCRQIDLGRWLGGHYAIAAQGPAEYEDGVPRAGNDAGKQAGIDADNDNSGAATADGNAAEPD